MSVTRSARVMVLWLGMFVFLAVGVTARAQTSAQPPTTAQKPEQSPEMPVVTETVVVTATKTERRISDVPAAVSVISAESLERLPVRNLSDAIRSVPSVDMASMSGMAARGNTQLAIRGVPGTRRALLMVDGMAANDLGYGSLANLDLVPTRGLQQVEVVRGPFSSLYGANAFGGVFNVITRRGAGRVTVEPFGAVGNAGYHQFGMTSQGGNERVSFSLTADRRKIDNVFGRDTQVAYAPSADNRTLVETSTPVANADYEDVRLLGRLDIKLSDRVSFALLPRMSRNEGGLGRTPRLPQPLDALSFTQTADLGTVIDVATRGRWKWQFRQGIRLAQNELTQENFTTTGATQTVTIRPGPFPVSTVTRSQFPFAALTREDSDYFTAFLEPSASVRTRAHTLTLGASVVHDRGTFSPHYILEPTNVLGSDQMMAGIAANIRNGMAAGGAPNPSVTFVRDEPITDVFPKTPGSRATITNVGLYAQDEWTVTQRVSLAPGVRIDDHSEFGAVASPKMGLILNANPRTRVRVSAGRAYRAPSLSELYGTIVFHGPIPGGPNPNLRPEFITALDGGVMRDIGKGMRLEGNVFFNSMKDLIQLTLAPSGTNFDWVNVSRSRSAGTELNLTGRPANWLNMTAHYGYTWSRDLDLARPLDQIPANKVFVSADGVRAIGKVIYTAGVMWRWYGDRLQDYRSVVTTLDAYSRTDLQLSASWAGRATAGITVQNLFNQRFQESAVNLAPARLVAFNLQFPF